MRCRPRIVLLVVLALMAGLAGCSSDTEQAAAPSPATTAPATAAEAPTPTPSPVTEVPSEVVIVDQAATEAAAARADVAADAAGIDFSWLALPPGEMYGEYTTLVDDTGTITVDVPAAWADVDGAPYETDGTEVPSIWAAPDLQQFFDSWGAPGMILELYPDIGSYAVSLTLEDLEERMGVDGCDDAGGYSYDDGAYQGSANLWFGCGETSGVLVVAARAGERVWGLAVQMATLADLEVAIEIIRSFDLTAEGLTGEEQSYPGISEFEEAGIDFSGLGLAEAEVYDPYIWVDDDTGSFQVSIPSAWSDVDPSSGEADGVSYASVWASPDLAGFFESWTVPGMLLDLRPAEIDRGAEEIAALATEVGVDDGCGEPRLYDYYDGAYSGEAALYPDCGGPETAAYLIVHAGAGEDVAYMWTLQVQMATTADVEAAYQIIRSFHRTAAPPPADGDDPQPAPVDDPVLEAEGQESIEAVADRVGTYCGDHFSADWGEAAYQGDRTWIVTLHGVDANGAEMSLRYEVNPSSRDEAPNWNYVNDADTQTAEICSIDEREREAR